MNWVMKLERIDDAGNLQSTIIGYVERPDVASEADLGLTHDEGKCLIRRLQAEIAQNQVEALIAKARPCPCCRRLRSVKEHRRRQIDTMFGHLRIHAPRFEACACGRSAASSPVASLFPHRTTPELRHLQVKLGSKLSYKQAADILNGVSPGPFVFQPRDDAQSGLGGGEEDRSGNEGRDRRETDRRDARRPYDRRHRRRLRQSRAHENQRKNFEIVLGRINSGSCSGKVFAAVRDLDDLARERVRSALRTAGRGPATNLTGV